MEITTSVDRALGVVHLAGNLTAGEPEAMVPDSVTRLLDDGCRHIVIDLSDVQYVDSGGLGALVRCYKRCAANTAELRLAGVSDRLQTLFRLARLTDLFVIFDDLEAAMRGGDG